MKKICFITAIYSNYEKTCKPYITQTIPTDFICFTDNSNIQSNGWIIDTTPYHIINKSQIDNDIYVNSLHNNTHTFNIAKYYKQAFNNIPRLQEYEIIVWIDGTIQITHPFISKWVVDNIYNFKIITWEHEYRNGILFNEVIESIPDPKYSSTIFNMQIQPIQNILNQYKEYINDGFEENLFKKLIPNRKNIGIWLTCFVAFLRTDKLVQEFLDLWYLQTLKLSTQDQVSFPYVCQKLKFIPYTLPDDSIKGEYPSTVTDIYIKHNHFL